MVNVRQIGIARPRCVVARVFFDKIGKLDATFHQFKENDRLCSIRCAACTIVTSLKVRAFFADKPWAHQFSLARGTSSIARSRFAYTLHFQGFGALPMTYNNARPGRLWKSLGAGFLLLMTLSLIHI